MTSFVSGFCGFTNIKQRTASEYRKQFSDCAECVGIAFDEQRRLKRLKQNQFSILSITQTSEQNAYDICKRNNALSPIYSLNVKRDGCFFCPNTAECTRIFIKKHHPELADKIKFMFDSCTFSADRRMIMQQHKWYKDIYGNGDQ